MNPVKCRARIAVLYAVVSTVTAPNSRAADTQSSDAPSDRTVRMVAFSEEADGAFDQALRAGLSDTALRLEVYRSPSDASSESEKWDIARAAAGVDAPLFVFWIETEPTPSIRFYIPKSDGEVMETRELGQDSGAGVSECAAVLVRRMAESLLAVEVDLNEVPVPNADLKPEPILRVTIAPRKPAKELPQRLALEAAFRDVVESSAQPSVMGGRFSAGVGLRYGLTPFVAYTFQMPTVDAMQGMRLTRQSRPLELGLQLRLKVPRGGVRWRLSGALGIDILKQSTTGIKSRDAQQTVNNPVELSCLLGTAAEIAIAGPASFVAGVGMKILLMEALYYVEGATGRKLLHDSWPVQLDITVGLLFRFF